METIQFKTNIKCAGCIEKVTPHLDALEGVEDWQVDIANPNKILTVKADGIPANQIKETVLKAGFQAEVLERT